jgi:hypothetical protein
VGVLVDSISSMIFDKTGCCPFILTPYKGFTAPSIPKHIALTHSSKHYSQIDQFKRTLGRDIHCHIPMLHLIQLHARNLQPDPHLLQPRNLRHLEYLAHTTSHPVQSVLGLEQNIQAGALEAATRTEHDIRGVARAGRHDGGTKRAGRTEHHAQVVQSVNRI